MSLKSSQEAVLLDNPDPGTTIVLLTRIRILPGLKKLTNKNKV